MDKCLVKVSTPSTDLKMISSQQTRSIACNPTHYMGISACTDISIEMQKDECQPLTWQYFLPRDVSIFVYS